MVDPTEVGQGDIIEQVREMFGTGGAIRRVPYEIVEFEDDSVKLESVDSENSNVIEMSPDELRDDWYLPEEED
jgi:hypothetical protein